MVSILLGLGERCCSWQNGKHQKGISSREEGGEFYIKYMRFELMFAYWIDPFIRWTGVYIRSKDKRLGCQVIIEVMMMNELSESIKGNNIKIRVQRW